LAEGIAIFSVDKIPEILPIIMTQVSTYKNLSFPQQRSMIINMLTHLITITDGPGDDAIWDPILKQLLPGMIDLLVRNNNGKLVLKNRKIRSSRWPKFMPCYSEPETSGEVRISQSSSI
jgi:hypothetical protein